VPSPGMGASLGWRLGGWTGQDFACSQTASEGSWGECGYGWVSLMFSACGSREQAHWADVRNLLATPWGESIPKQRWDDGHVRAELMHSGVASPTNFFVTLQTFTGGSGHQIRKHSDLQLLRVNPSGSQVLCLLPHPLSDQNGWEGV
jgi:hypothetical protein